MIPNVIHFIDVGGREFSFIHYLAVITADTSECAGKYLLPLWHRTTGQMVGGCEEVRNSEKTQDTARNIRQIADLSCSSIRCNALGNSIRIRWNLLDLDAISINSLSPFLNHQVVMGREPESGLGSGVILAENSAEFLRIWYEKYQEYDGKTLELSLGTTYHGNFGTRTIRH